VVGLAHNRTRIRALRTPVSVWTTTGSMDRTEDSNDASNTARERVEDPRVRFAAERTLLAWVRTGVAMMGFGFVVARFGLFLRELSTIHHPETPHSTRLSLWIGTGLVVVGVVMTLLAAGQHWRIVDRLNRGAPYQAPKWSLGLIVALLLVVLGIGMVAYLVLVNHY
jgi:putative membrane protein